MSSTEASLNQKESSLKHFEIYFCLTCNMNVICGFKTVALVAQDGIEPERLEDLVAPSHVNTQVDRTVRTLEWNFLYGIYSRIGLNMT